MSNNLSFNLSYTASVINSVICLFNPSPAFQYGRRNDGTYQILNDNQLTRNNQFDLAGFSPSEIVQVDINGNPIYVPSTVDINLPANSYSVNLPSRVYGTNPINDNYSVLQINTALAKIEPGFSRLQVVYQYYNNLTSSYVEQTDYFDCPFYENWDVTAAELNSITEYVQNGYAFLQKEIDILNHQVSYALSREQWRGLIVSGKLSTTRATQGLQTGPLNSNEFSHEIVSKSLGIASSPTFSELKSGALAAGTSNIVLSQTNPVVEYGRDTSPNSTPGSCGYGFYVTEAVDGNGRRCIVLVDSAPWGGSSRGSITIRHDFTAVGGAVDRTLGQVNGNVFTHVTGYSGANSSNSTVPMASGITTTYPTQTGASPNQNVLGSYSRVYESYPFATNVPQRFAGFVATSNPVWMKGYKGDGDSGNNDGPSSNDNGVFSPPTSGPTNNTATGVVNSNWTAMNSANWDTVNIGGENYPRLIFYPDDSTTSITLQPMFFDFMTNDAYNAGGNQAGFNAAIEGLTLANSTMNGVSLNNGAGILPYTMNLVSVTPANGPQINSSSTPNYGCVGQQITVSGNYFNSTYDSAYIGGQPAAINVINPNTCQVTVPSVPVGPTTLQITDGIHSPSSINFTVNGQPSITSVNPSQTPVGTQITINGNNFGTQDGASTVSIGGQGANISSWSNSAIVVTVPPGLNLGPNQIVVNTDCGESTTSSFSVSSGDKLLVNPHTLSISETNSYQLSATFYSGSNATDVSNGSGTTWSVNGQVGGENVHGTISQSGLYMAPASNPPDTIVITVQYYDNNTGKFLSDNCTVTLNASPLIVISPSVVTLAPGVQQQFTVTLAANGMETDVTNSSNYLVNDTPGGDSVDGFITSSGIYTSPINLAADTIENITATYSYNGNTLYATSKATVSQANSTYATLTVQSQINIYLGDGRFGYVPVGSQIIAYPNQYVYVQFQESLDSLFHLPNPAYLPVQQLSLNVKNALDSDIANVLYNLGDAVLQNDGTTQTLRTVVLGIIDPSDGRFHSAWDIANPNPVAQNAMSLGLDLNNPGIFADSVKAFSGPHTFKGSLIDYINDLSGGAQSQIDSINNRSNIIVVGKCSYDNKNEKFHIISKLNILGVSGKNTYGILATIEPQTIDLKQNQYVYIDSNLNVKTGNFTDVFTGARDSNTIILGAVMGDFQSTWSLIKMTEVENHVNNLGEDSYIRVGPLLIQWGYTEEISLAKNSKSKVDINFQVPYTASYTVLSQTYKANGGMPVIQNDIIDLQNASVEIMNKANSSMKTKIAWCTIGM